MSDEHTWIIGTAADCDVRVDDEYASPHHARMVRRTTGRYWIEDLGSTNGTQIIRDGQRLRVKTPTLVLPGDTIAIGRSEIPWRPPAAAEPEFTGEQLEEIFHEALKAGDVKGVEAALTVMCGVDPERAIRLYNTLKEAIIIAEFLRGKQT